MVLCGGVYFSAGSTSSKPDEQLLAVLEKRERDVGFLAFLQLVSESVRVRGMRCGVCDLLLGDLALLEAGQLLARGAQDGI